MTVIAAVRARRHHPYLIAGLGLLFLVWLSLFISSTCLMPRPVQDLHAPVSGCPEHAAPDSGQLPAPDCSLKPCAEPQAEPWQDLNFLPGLAIILPGVLWLIGLLLRPVRLRLRDLRPPDGRRIPLIYRYCTLLN